MAEAEKDLVIPEGGFWPAPAIPQPNIYPMEWRVETAKLAAIYEKSKLTLWNPADLPWDGLRAKTAGPEASKLASTENQYMMPRRCSMVKSSGCSPSHPSSAGFQSVSLDFW